MKNSADLGRNIFALFGGIRNSETSLHGLGVSEIQKHYIFALFGGIRNSKTSLHGLGVSEIRKHLCILWGYPKLGNIFALFGEIRNSETSLHSLGVYEIRKPFFSLLGCFQISSETFDLSSAIFCFRVIGEFLLLVFILNSRFRENKENSILCKGGVLEIRAKFTFNFFAQI